MIFSAKSFQKTCPRGTHEFSKLREVDSPKLTIVLNQPECAVACCVSSPVRMAAAAAVISNMDEPFRASGGQVNSDRGALSQTVSVFVSI